MPLELELAVIWLRARSCHKISARIASNVEFEATPYHNMPERHRSLLGTDPVIWNSFISNDT